MHLPCPVLQLCSVILYDCTYSFILDEHPASFSLFLYHSSYAVINANVWEFYLHEIKSTYGFQNTFIN